MKNLLIAILLVFSLQTLAQSFEGTIKWKISMEITDPKVKAQMEEAQKQMQDPEKIKEMQERMNDPQMKAMMEKNPQMKAQMEKALAMMQDGDTQSMMPTSMMVKIKDGNMVSQMEGGFVQNEFIYLKDKNETFMVDRDSKTYTVLRTNQDNSMDSVKTKVTRTGEKTRILNYTCTKYEVERTVGGVPTKQYIWSTTEVKGIDMSAIARQQAAAGNKQALFYREIEGLPLRMEMQSQQGTMTMEVSEINRGSLPQADFTIPAGYKENKNPMGFGY